MTHFTHQEIFKKYKIIPVVVLNDIEKANLVTDALLAGGINIMEITLRTPNGLGIIRKLRRDYPDMVIGAGTVLNEIQYVDAINNGAQFIVSPGISDDLINISKKNSIPFLPGAITPSEVIRAIDNGFNYLKYFPAEIFNGLNTIKAYSNIFPQIKFCPTGGVNLANVKEYLSLSNVCAIGCSFLVTKDIIENNKFDEITTQSIKIKSMLNE